MWFHETLHRNLRQHIVDVFRGHLRKEFRLRGAWRDAINQDIFARQLLRHGFGHSDQPRLGGAVMRGVRVTLLAGNRAHIDDATVTVFEHRWHDEPAGQVRRNEVHLDDPPPYHRIELPGYAIATSDSGVVDQYVDVTETRERVLRSSLHGILTRDVREAGIDFPDRS